METSIAKRRTACRLCGDKKLSLVLPINASPIADAFVTVENVHNKQPLVPLDLYQCANCGHVQNLDIVNPELLFRDYIFTTSSSNGLVAHFRNYAQDVTKRFPPLNDALVVEIGSNDGTLLGFFKQHGMRVLGVDPARDISEKATISGIETINDFFSYDLSEKIKKTYGPAKFIVANNVYAHADDLANITDGIENLLAEDGVFVFEVSYLLDIIDNFVFDTVYHEHLSYHSIKPFKEFFDNHGLDLFDIETISNKGGSIRGYVQKKSGLLNRSPVVTEMIKNEEARGLHTPEIFFEYEQKIAHRKGDLTNYLRECANKNLQIAGYGASTTVTTLMYHFELTDKLNYLIDDNQKKHGLFSPGCHLEVKSSEALYTETPDVVVILAWQYAEPIIAKHRKFIENGGTFIIPLPYLRVIDKSGQTN